MSSTTRVTSFHKTTASVSLNDKYREFRLPFINSFLANNKQSAEVFFQLWSKITSATENDILHWFSSVLESGCVAFTR